MSDQCYRIPVSSFQTVGGPQQKNLPRALRRINSLGRVFFTKAGNVAILNRAMMCEEHNETTQELYVNSSPGTRFPYHVSDLGGVRLIM